jgi:hypothetical protein
MRKCGICSSLVVTTKSSPTLDENLGQNILVVVRQERPARPRFQPPDAGERGLHLVDLGRPVPRAISGMRRLPSSRHEIADDAVFEGFLPARRVPTGAAGIRAGRPRRRREGSKALMIFRTPEIFSIGSLAVAGKLLRRWT